MQPQVDVKNQVADLILGELKHNAIIQSSYVWALDHGIPHHTVIGVLKSLEAKCIASIEQKTFIITELTQQGLDVLQNGSPEALLWKQIGNRQLSPAECSQLLSHMKEETVKAIISSGIKLNYFTVDKSSKAISRKNQEIVDAIREQCQQVSCGKQIDKKDFDYLKRRQYVVQKSITEYLIKPGDKISEYGIAYDTDITEEMLRSGSWKTANFKEYNFLAMGSKILGGSLHPLLKIREEIRMIFLTLGFEEMPTNQFVDSSFWNFDALFQPQFHPARDLHDTFFIEDPAETHAHPADYVLQVKDIHEKGGFGSLGYRYEWKEKESQKNVLRTHTTATSIRMIYALAQEYKKTGKFTPKKYFSIDRVFRNEATDQTHLAEFHQCEGLIVDYNLTLRDLIGTLKSYYERQGLENLQFKPTYNPYTEPSMEIYAFHPKLKKYVEIGNSGMFRPEVLKPAGIPDGVRVIAWGLSLERPAMIKYEVQDIRSLIGPEVPYDFIRSNPICRINK
ncbi:uncharacterized protein LOC126316710 [Schistocerca gregaria]|uniref:uncharacterized protein LOC126316710 n=1 Tax=Schistocerca gregaria TaxID=7010 RepID=UPI00211E9159|nr:uncharacterized protein LOC126316710 [Schistocerca gregaria]